MKLMKKMFALLVAGSVVSGCSNVDHTASVEKVSETFPTVVCTNFAAYDFARQVMKDQGEVVLLVKPGVETHSFEPTPQDIMTIQNANVFVYAGGDSDVWVETILNSMDTSKMHQISMMDCVETMEEEIKEGMVHEHHHDDEKDCCDNDEDMHEHEDHDHEEDHDHDHEHEEEDHDHDHDHDHDEHHHDHEEMELDEHVWTSPLNAIVIVNKLRDVLSEVDAEHASVYADNASAYVSELEELDAMFRDVVKNGKRNEIIVGDRFPFLYFVKEYGIDYYAAYPGCSSDTQVDAKTVAFLVDKVKDDNIPVVFHIELSNEQMCDAIVDGTGASKELLNAVHNVSVDEFNKGVTYVDLMKHNVEVLKKALGE